MPKHVFMLAAAVMLLNGAAVAHSWYPKECCHDKDCHPVPCLSPWLLPALVYTRTA